MEDDKKVCSKTPSEEYEIGFVETSDYDLRNRIELLEKKFEKVEECYSIICGLLEKMRIDYDHFDDELDAIRDVIDNIITDPKNKCN